MARATLVAFKDFTVKQSSRKLEWDQEQRKYWKQNPLVSPTVSNRMGTETFLVYQNPFLS